MKKYHRLKENKSTTIHKRVIFFDTEAYLHVNEETGETTHTFRLATAIYRYHRAYNRIQSEKYSTLSNNDLCAWIVSKSNQKERLYVISSNIWYDMRLSQIVPYLISQGWTNKGLISNGMSIIISFKKASAKIIFLNLQNYFRTSIESLGHVFGIEKLSVNFDNVTNDELLTYCARDTEILCKSMTEFYTIIKEHDLGCIGLTFPSTAFNVFRHKFMFHKIYIHDNEDVIRLERDSYFGGRTECFRIGEFKDRDLVMIDINSMYPYVMRNNQYPTRLKWYGKSLPLKNLDYFLHHYCMTAKVILKTDKPCYAYRHNNKCIFPIGTFETCLNTPSLRYAFNNNHILDIKDFAVYSKGYIFKKYIDFFYALRLQYKQACNKPFEILCKYLLNSLYGKFGQRGDEIISTNDCDTSLMERYLEIDADDKKIYIITKFAGKCYKILRNQSEGFNSFVSVAAHVTDYARMYLWQWIDYIGLDNIYYCDTDCLIIEMSIMNNIKLPIDDIKLGYFKLEKEGDYLEIRGLKDYTFDDKTKIKGVSKKANKINDNTYSQVYFPGIFSELRKGIGDNYKSSVITKHLKRIYDKGDVLQDGKVIPLRFS